MTLLLAIDQGTSSSRAMLFDASGRVVGQAQQPFDMQFPADGWVEQDPEVLWSTTLTAIRAAFANAGCRPADVTAIGITNQRETTLLWDRGTGKCLHNAIVWQDRRTASRCQELEKAGEAERIRRITGLVNDPYFSATKLAWLLDEIPGARSRAERGELCFGTVDSFLIFRLTGGRVHATDATNASRTALFDLTADCWSEELLDLHNIPASVLPDVKDCVADFGVTQAEHFGAAVPILGVAGDQQAALIGQNCLVPGMTKSTYGTGCFLICNTGTQLRQSESQLLGTIAYRLGGTTTFALEGSIFVAGVAIKWLRDQLGLISDAAESQLLAQSIDGDTQGVYVVPAFTGLGAPYWEPRARGHIGGLTLDSTRAQVVTATIASVAYQTHELANALAQDGAPIRSLRVDGGMVVNDWLCQFISDILDTPVQRPAVTETTALGVAMLAGVGAGVYSDLNAAGESWQPERAFNPSMSAAVRDVRIKGWQKAVTATLAGCA